jgi:8-oxo-dGTP pyrophosphatase MutT (NUDIX family)
MHQPENPWTIIERNQVYENPWITVTEFQVVNPAGGPGIYGTVHYKNKAIGIIPLDEQGNTWLVGQFRFPLSQYSWEIPEGGGHMNEEPLEAAKRELLEETGLVAQNWTKILEMHLSNSVSDEHSIIYLAQNLTQGKAAPEETELLALKKIPITQAMDMVQSGEITDAMSVAAIQQVQWLIYQNKLKK